MTAEQPLYIAPDINESPEMQQGPEWFERELVHLGMQPHPRTGVMREASVEVVKTSNESGVVAFSTEKDGSHKVILVRRRADAMGKGATSITLVSKADPGSIDTPATIALQAVDEKLGGPDLGDLELNRIGKLNAWKYLTSDTEGYELTLPTDAETLIAAGTSNSSTQEILAYSEEEVLQAITNREIVDGRTIATILLALAERRGMLTGEEPPEEFQDRIRTACRTLPNFRREITPVPIGKDYFPRKIFDDDEDISNGVSEVIVEASDEQAGALCAITEDGASFSLESLSFLFNAEPSLAQGKAGLTLPSGSIDPGEDGVQTVLKEIRQETRYIADPESVTPLLTGVRPLSMYLDLKTHSYLVRVRAPRGAEAEAPTGADELPVEQGTPQIVPAKYLWWCIKEGYITDVPTLCAVLTFMFQNEKYFASRKKH